ncbi:MAG: hypothetical protein J6Y29_02100 [Clostridiales bacterium]|nr:hypothetical protein [Clostridiales bacterium]
MELFYEILVKKELTLKDKASTILCIAVILVTSVFGVGVNSFIFMFAPFVFVLSFVAIYYIIVYRYIEFEYILVNDELDIDKIMGKRKRKKLVTIKKSNVVHVGSVSDNEYKKYKKASRKVIEAMSCKSQDNCYIALNDNKSTLVIINKNDDILKAIR